MVASVRWVYSHQCSALPLGVPSCKPFWLLAVGFSVAVGVSMCLYLIYWSVRHMRAYKSYQAWLADRERVDPDLDSKKWHGDDAAADVSQAELAEKIREAVKKNQS